MHCIYDYYFIKLPALLLEMFLYEHLVNSLWILCVFQLIPDPEFLTLLKTVGAESSQTVKDFEVYTIQQVCRIKSFKKLEIDQTLKYK